MTGFNMPPGCSPRDIPGNEPEDPVYEAIAGILQENIGGTELEIGIDDLLIQIMEQVSIARQTAYNDGCVDTERARLSRGDDE